MSYIDDIQTAFDAHADIAEYRINLAQRRSVRVGIRDNDVGSVYSPFAFGQGTGGSFLVQWRDGRLSRGNLDGNSLLILDQILATARQAAYDDSDAAQFLGPQQIHEVPLWSDDVPTLFEERSGYLLDAIEVLRGAATKHRANTLNGGVGGGDGESWLRTSQGLALSTRSTSFSYSASFDGIIGEGESLRTIAPLDQIEAQIEHAGVYLDALRTPLDGGSSGTRLVVLHPSVAYSLWGYYLWGNMGGSSIYHGQSPFSAADFAERRQILRDDISVAIDPWQPLDSGSFMYTSEGLPSAPITYIERGRIQQPIVDLKYARRLGLPPTTPPGSGSTVRFTARSIDTWETLQPQIDDALLVLSVLGLHTQDRTSGNFSLTASQALLIRDGTIAGRVKATISGNLLELLNDDALRLATFAGQDVPGFIVPMRVTIELIA